MKKASNFKKWISERMGHSPQLKLALEAIKELELELGLVKISLEHKGTLLNSCEIALEREQYPKTMEERACIPSLLSAVRQYRHNDSDEFVIAYDKQKVEKIIDELNSQIEFKIKECQELSRACNYYKNLALK